MKPIFAPLCALFIFAAPAAALAQTATYEISGNFTAPATGSFSGSYVVNTGPNTIVSATIQVTAGKATDGVTDLPANNFIYAGFEAGNALSFATALPATGLRGGVAILIGTKAAPGAVSSFSDGVCGAADCSSASISPTVGRSGSGTVALALAPAPVPTLSEWAMIVFGLILAGSAAVYIQRRPLPA